MHTPVTNKYCVCVCVYIYIYISHTSSRVVLEGKNPLANAGDMRDMGVIRGSEDPLEEGMATHFQYSCLENSTDRGAW